MAIRITGKYVSARYCEYDSPGGALPVLNEAKDVDLSAHNYRSYFTFVHEDGLVKLTSTFVESGFTTSNTFILDKVVQELVEEITWTVYATIKPNNTLKVMRVCDRDGILDHRTIQYMFTPTGLVVTTTRNDNDDVLVAYKFDRLPETGDTDSVTTEENHSESTAEETNGETTADES